MKLHDVKRQIDMLRDVDVLGIGFGPSNIALMIAMEEAGSPLSVHFVEAAASALWQPEMLLQGSDIQNNPLRDLVTPRNPCSRYSFTNYLKCEGRLFDYLNLGLAYPFRKDYARYVSWAASFFEDHVDYGAPASAIEIRDGRWHVETPRGNFSAAALVLGTGRSRNVPDVFRPTLGPRVFHLSDYLKSLEALGPDVKSIGVIGASQSAVEIHNDLMARFPTLEIHAIHRSFAMRQKDTSPFSDHVYFPEFVDYFFSMDAASRTELNRQLRGTNYSAADLDVLHRLYVTIYEEKLDGRNRFHLHNNTDVDGVSLNGDQVTLALRDRFRDRATTLTVDAVVLATGFKDLGTGEGCEAYPPILAGVADDLQRRGDAALDVERDYRVQTKSGLALYLNGLCESSHGLGDAGSFSLLSLRSADIAASLEDYFEPGRSERAVQRLAAAAHFARI